MLLELKNLFLEDGGKKDLHYEMDLSQAVSYTHLTLPTILLV